MAAPSRTQIETRTTLPKYKVSIYLPTFLGGVNMWDVIPNNMVESVDVSLESSGNKNNGIAFGTYVSQSATIKFSYDAAGPLSGGLRYRPLKITKVRIEYAYGTSDYITCFEGVLTTLSFTDSDVTYACSGYEQYIKDTKLFTKVFYKRPIATETTLASMENPDDSSYVGGMINEMLWRSGGRPWLQKDIRYNEDSAGFKFWYMCDQSLFSPQYTWLNGENLFDDMLLLVRAAGGQIYQNKNIIQYREPLSYANAIAPIYTFGTNTFESVSVTNDSAEQVDKLIATYTPRALEPVQEVYSDTTPIFIDTNESKTLELETQLPTYEYTSYDLQAIDLDGKVITIPVTSTVETAQKVTKVIVNNLGKPILIHTVKIKGRPVGARQEKQVTYGSGLNEKTLENNPYIQDEYHAAQITRMTYDFYAETKPVFTLNGCIYDPDRYIGELVYFNYSLFGYQYVVMRIISINPQNTGSTMDVQLVPVDGLPIRDDMFIIGTFYDDSTVKQLSY